MRTFETSSDVWRESWTILDGSAPSSASRISIVLGISHSRRESLLLVGETVPRGSGGRGEHRDRLHAHAAHTHLPVAAAASPEVQHRETSVDKRETERGKGDGGGQRGRGHENKRERHEGEPACTTLRFDCRTCTKNREPVLPSPLAPPRRGDATCRFFSLWTHDIRGIQPRHGAPVVKRFRSIFKWPPNRHCSSSPSLSLLLAFPFPARPGNRQTTFPPRSLRRDSLDLQIARAPDTSDAQ